MTDWYLELSLFNRGALWLLVVSYIFVFYLSFQALKGSPAVWYRGFFTTPVFQVLMWIAILPLVIPFFLLAAGKWRQLKSAVYIGNMRSRIFHRRDCEYQQMIASIFFRYPLSSVIEAEELGFQGCHVCRPEGWSA